MRAKASRGNIRGARAWKRVQVHAAGLTQNRRAELQSELNNFKQAASFDDFSIVLPKRERKVRGLEHFPQFGATDEVKMDFLLKITPTPSQQHLGRRLQLRKAAVLRGQPGSPDPHAEELRPRLEVRLARALGMIIGEVSTEQTTENAQTQIRGRTAARPAILERLGRRWNF